MKKNNIFFIFSIFILITFLFLKRINVNEVIKNKDLKI